MRSAGGRGQAGRVVVALLALALALGACGSPDATAVVALVEPTSTPAPTPTPTRTPPPTATATIARTATPARTATAVRTVTPTLAATARPATGGAISDFSAWYVGESDPAGRHRRSYSAATGEYLVDVLEEDQEWSFYAPDTALFQNFRLDVEGRMVTGRDGTGYGLVFRRQERQTNQQTSERYIFYVTAQGFYGFFYVGGDNKATWLQNVTPASGVAKVGTTPNMLSVICRGTAVQLLINGVQVYETSELTLNKAGNVGIFALSAPGSAQTTRVAFKGIKLTDNP